MCGVAFSSAFPSTPKDYDSFHDTLQKMILFDSDSNKESKCNFSFATFSFCGSPEPFEIFAAFFNKSLAGGVFVTKVNVLSS